jgi:hypothetical protein
MILVYLSLEKCVILCWYGATCAPIDALYFHEIYHTRVFRLFFEGDIVVPFLYKRQAFCPYVVA